MGGIKNKLSKLIYEPPFRKRRQMKSGISLFSLPLPLTLFPPIHHPILNPMLSQSFNPKMD